MRRGSWFVYAAVLFVLGSQAAFAQRADVSGVVLDQTGAVLPGVTLTIVNADQGLKREAVTDEGGHFSVSLLPPGRYVLTAQLDGFAPFEMNDLVLNVGDALALSIKMEVAGVGEAITVKGEATRSTASAAVGTVVDRQFVENIPLNGGTLQSLLSITPGVVLGSGDGQLSVNGMRTESNYLTVDGVSANIGVSRGGGTVTSISVGLGVPGNADQNAAGATPGYSAMGTTNNLFSIEELQEFKTETSNANAAAGRQAGGQIGITTRSGTNTFSGSVYESFRDDRFDATDWFTNASAAAVPKQELSQHLFGATLGGPIFRNRTFFFTNYEGLRLTLPQAATVRLVPSTAIRNLPGLHPTVKTLLDGYPMPTDESASCATRTIALSAEQWNALPAAQRAGAAYSPTVPAGTVLAGCYVDASSSTSNLNAFRVRIDHTFTASHSVWGRFNMAPFTGQGDTFAVRQNQDGDTYTFTAGYRAVLSARAMNEFTVNWSRNTADAFRRLVDLGGAVPYDASLLLPAGAPENSQVVVGLPTSLASSSTTLGRNLGNEQEQWNVTNNLRFVSGRHTWGAGFDFRRMLPLYSRNEYQASYIQVAQTSPTVRTTLDMFTASSPIIGQISRFANDTVGVSATNFSAYVQDRWAVSPRLSLDVGLRWELNTPPTGTDKPLYTLVGFPDANALTLTTDPFFETIYNAFAPRVGVAYRLSETPGRETVLRGGYGLYYDLGQGSLSAAALQYPYVRQATPASLVPFPASDASLAPPPPFSLEPPYTGQSFTIMAPGYVLPRVHQWNATVERALGGNTISISYVGSSGRRLLRRYFYGFASTFPAAANNPLPANPDFINARLNVTRNDGEFADESNYNALQLSFFRRMSRGLQVLANYTWSRAEDTGSSSVNSATGSNSAGSANLGQSGAAEADESRGDSDFDRRHLFNTAISYELPRLETSGGAAGLLNAVFVSGWAADLIFKYQSAAPITPFYGYLDNVSGVNFPFRPDLVSGQAAWIDDGSAPGGKRLNPSAFAVPDGVGAGLQTARNGNLERNSIRGFDLYQMDLSLRRTFPFGRYKAQFRWEVFNLTNHPNFAPPNNFLGTVSGATGAYSPSSSFGRVTSMFARATTAGGGAGGLAPIYAIGGPRSMQFSVKFMF
ncbi:MAG: TonB-dependent receptor [Vicinamibacterales bacterium]|nr:TonB-dependent receptor [Vicinamibacterales bacterium]